MWVIKYLWMFSVRACVLFIYTISFGILCVSQEELSVTESNQHMWLLQLSKFWKTKTLWNFAEYIFKISNLFIQCNTDSCCEHITCGVNIYIMVLQCSKLFNSKVETGILRQYLQNSYSLGKVQNLGCPELSEEKI